MVSQQQHEGDAQAVTAPIAAVTILLLNNTSKMQVIIFWGNEFIGKKSILIALLIQKVLAGEILFRI